MRPCAKRTLCIIVLLSMLLTLAIAFPLSTTASSNPTASAISVGNHFMILQTDTGEVWGWGDNSNGVLCTAKSNGINQDITVPTKINLPASIKSTAISAGFDHVLMLGSDGNVYAWGNNACGQLGRSASDDPVVTPSLVEGLRNKKIVAIAAGRRFSLALSEDGSVYSFGWNNKQQLGYASANDSTDFSEVPTKIETLNGIAQIITGYDSAVAIDEDGKAYLWGSTKNCVLGTDEGTSAFQTPTLLPDTKTTTPITSVAISQNHSAFLLNNGTVGFMGLNTYGQYGNETTGSTPSVRFKITDTSTLGVNAIAVSDDQTVLLGADGKVYTAGARMPGNSDGSASSTFVSPFEESASAPLATAIAAGYRNGAMIAQDGSVWAWGDNSHGQLGNGKAEEGQAAPIKVLKSDDLSYVTDSTPYVKDVPITFKTNVPAPKYAITIPTTIDLGELRQTDVGAQDRYAWTSFEVQVQNVENLYGEKAIQVSVAPGNGNTFCLQDEDGNVLLFDLFRDKETQTPISEDRVLEQFTQSDQVVQTWIRIDQSTISTSGVYNGVLTFHYSIVDIEE